ncbi:MAG: hypothetical protein HY908_08520 [Myxococcales bacterium]|nr:hypothetical protein [Myxococcales bacterium]
MIIGGAAYGGCKKSTTTDPGTGGSGNTTTTSTTTSSTTTTTTTTGTGGNAGFQCDTVAISDPNCDPALADQCGCLGCDPTVCTDANGGAVSDCVCPSCDTDTWCTTHCTDDGLCDPLNEGCGCTDCLENIICTAG